MKTNTGKIYSDLANNCRKQASFKNAIISGYQETKHDTSFQRKQCLQSRKLKRELKKSEVRTVLVCGQVNMQLYLSVAP
jgi:hypothetical protein